MRGLNEAVVIVTGGATGIGAAAVTRFIDEGAHVVIADVQADPARDLAERLGERAEFVATDVTDEDSIAGLVDTVVERHGRLDVFVANAAVFGAIGPIAEQRTADVDLTIAVNLRGVILSLKHAARAMQPRRSGSIIVTASPGGIVGGAGPHVYSATKAGVVGLARSVAAELRAYGIRVNTVVPGAVVSPMTASAIVGDAQALEQTTEAMTSSAMLDRAGQPDDIAGAMAFLASDDARYMTGSEVFVDAGYTHASGSAAFAQPTHAGRGALLEGGRTS